jgi:uncharacterized protein YuzE
MKTTPVLAKIHILKKNGIAKNMKIEYDSKRDLLYIYLSEAIRKVAKTVKITPGVHADFDRSGRLSGIEILDASTLIDQKIEFDFSQMRELV